MSSTAAAAVLAASNKKNAEIRGYTADTTYKRKLNRFKGFVIEQRKLGVLPHSYKYLSRESIDLYCFMVVAKLTCAP